MLKVVLDTNIILSSVSRKSPYHVIFKKLLAGSYELYLTTDILLEYEEKLSANFSADLAELITSALMLKQNVKKVTTYFDLALIVADYDDNKFVNCAFTANVNYLVSNDKHFNVLKSVPFPQINVLKIDDFIAILKEID